MKAHPARIRAHVGACSIESRGAALGERVVAFLRQRYPSKTADNVAADTGLPVNTIKTWLNRGSAPDGDGYTALWIAYGPEFLAAAGGRRTPRWVRDLRAEWAAADLKAEIAALERKLSEVRA